MSGGLTRIALRPNDLRTVAIIVGLAMLVTLVGALVNGVSTRGMFQDVSRQRRHLREIRIAPEACVAVGAIHDQLNAFQLSYLAANLGMDPKVLEGILDPKPRAGTGSQPFSRPAWPTTKAELDVAAQRLDGALLLGTPGFPQPVRRHLGLLRADLAAGRIRLGTSRRPSDLGAAAGKIFHHGQLEAGYASDLIGNQCAVRLGADNF